MGQWERDDGGIQILIDEEKVDMSLTWDGKQ